jgi:hypothetical protein
MNNRCDIIKQHITLWKSMIAIASPEKVLFGWLSHKAAQLIGSVISSNMFCVFI